MFSFYIWETFLVIKGVVLQRPAEMQFTIIRRERVALKDVKNNSPTPWGDNTIDLEPAHDQDMLEAYRQHGAKNVS